MTISDPFYFKKRKKEEDFKTISSLLSLKDCYAKENDIVLSIMTKRGLFTFDEAKIAKDVCCENCGSRNGFININGRIWHCANPFCKISEKKEHKTAFSLKTFGVPDKYIDASIKECNQAQEIVKFLENFHRSKISCVTLQGKSETGKTYASIASMDQYRISGGVRGRFLNMADLYILWKDCIRLRESERSLIEPFVDCEFLIMDDLGTRSPSEAYIDLVYLLIDKRTNSIGKKTVVTTNLKNEEIKEYYGGRILSRLGSGKFILFEDGGRRRSENSQN